MKKMKEIEALFAELAAVSEKGTAAELQFKANDELARSFFGMAHASEREFMETVRKYKAHGSRIELLDDALCQRKDAKAALEAHEAEHDRLIDRLDSLVKTEAATLSKVITTQIETARKKVGKALHPYFSEVDMLSLLDRTKPVAELDRKLKKLRPFNELPLLWAAVQEIDSELNGKAA